MNTYEVIRGWKDPKTQSIYREVIERFFDKEKAIEFKNQKNKTVNKSICEIYFVNVPMDF